MRGRFFIPEPPPATAEIFERLKIHKYASGNSQNPFGLKLWRGKQGRPFANFIFPTEERRQKFIDKEKTSETASVEYKREMKSKGSTSPHALAAKNVRTDLKKAFPGVKFSVTSDVASMTSSVDIRWTLGPTEAQVKELVNKYETHKKPYDSEFREKFGSVRFVFPKRDYGEEVYEVVGRELCRVQSVEYKGRDTREVFGSGDRESLGTHVYRILAINEWPVGAHFYGLVLNPDDNLSYYKPSFEPGPLAQTLDEMTSEIKAANEVVAITGAGSNVLEFKRKEAA
jgi:hypothetical protein